MVAGAAPNVMVFALALVSNHLVLLSCLAPIPYAQPESHVSSINRLSRRW